MMTYSILRTTRHGENYEKCPTLLIEHLTRGPLFFGTAWAYDHDDDVMIHPPRQDWASHNLDNYAFAPLNYRIMSR